MCQPMYLCAYVVQNLRNGVLLFITISTLSCNNNKNKLEETKHFPSYPSASGIEFYNNNFFIIGDDATDLLIADSNLNLIDSIRIYNGTEKRIAKSEKPDIESASITIDNKLLLLGSGSISPQRNKGYLFDPRTRKTDSIRLDTFFKRLTLNGIKELNIEGATALPGSFLLAARGSKGYPKNHLVITEKKFWKKQTMALINPILVGTNTDSNRFSGISGLAYAAKSDRLIITVSTEDTRNAVDDGAIGNSYLWIIKNFSSKKRWKAINPDQIIDLVDLDSRFKGHKIESACIIKETNDFLHLMLATDNDNGSSTFFKLIVQKK
jgi:hypothetical protein